MIEIKVENHQDHSQLIVASGNKIIMRLDVPRPIDNGAYYRQIGPILAPMVRNDESYLYVGHERLRMTIEPLTGFMSSGGRGVVDLIREMQEDTSSEDEAWKPSNILNTVLGLSQEAQEFIKEQAQDLEEKNNGLLKDQEAYDIEEEDRKLEKAILKDRQAQRTMTPIEAARHKAARRRRDN